MITAIYVKGEAKLTIVTHQDLKLEKMDDPKPPATLRAGQNTVSVSRGVYKVLSKEAVGVIADAAPIFVAATPQDKGGTLDPPKALAAPHGFMDDLDPATLKRFFSS